MIKIYDNESKKLLGTISEDQLKFLVDQLEEEFEEDRDYYINKATLDMLEAKGMDANLLQFLKNALGDREGMEILWSKS